MLFFITYISGAYLQNHYTVVFSIGQPRITMKTRIERTKNGVIITVIAPRNSTSKNTRTIRAVAKARQTGKKAPGNQISVFIPVTWPS